MADSYFLRHPILLLMMRRDFIEKVRLGHHEHLLNAFWQRLETWIIQYARIHGQLRNGVVSTTPFLNNSPKPDLFQTILLAALANMEQK